MGAREEAIVQEFCDAWGNGKAERPDIDKILSMMSDDVYWSLNVPNGQVLRGRGEIRAAVEAAGGSINYCRCGILQVASTDRAVFHERRDSFLNDGKAVEHPLMAIYELNEQGKICAWREYYDHLYLAAQGGDVPGMPPVPSAA